MPTVLVILPEGFEEIETVTPVDVLRRAGVQVTIAALGPDILVTGRNGMTLRADASLEGLPPTVEYDLIFLPGGPGFTLLREDQRVLERLRTQAAAGKDVAAICAAPAVLHKAGLLEGRRYTAHFSVADTLPHILADERVVVDGGIVTSRGAGTALDFGLALVEKLISPEAAQEVRKNICA